MSLVDQYIANEEGNTLQEVFGIDLEVSKEYAQTCWNIREATNQTDKLLDKRTTTGQLVVEMMRSCDPQTPADLVTFIVVVKELLQPSGMNPATMMLLKLLGRLGGNNE